MVQVDLFGRAPQVIIDVHEVKARSGTSIKLFAEFLKREGIYYRVEKLPVGDLILPSGYAVERKTVKDFVHSLFGSREGRLRLLEQVRALAEAYERPILLLEGGLAIRPDPLNKCIYIPVARRKIGERLWQWIDEQVNIHPGLFESAIREIESMGVQVIRTFDVQHGAKILIALFKKAKSEAKSETEAFAVARAKPKLKTLREQQIFFLSGLPGINQARAQKILEVYRTPMNALNKVNRWDVDIEGIGEKIIEKIRRVLFTDFNEAKDMDAV